MTSQLQDVSSENIRRLEAVETMLEQAEGLSAGDWLVPLAAFVGAALAAFVHLYIGRRSLRANVIAEARKVWMAELREDLADLLSEAYMPFSSDSKDYDTKKRVNSAVGRVRLRLTPDNLRETSVTLDRDRHDELEASILKLSRLLFEYIDMEDEKAHDAKYDEVCDQASVVEDVARRIFYDTWSQIKSDVLGPGLWRFWKRRDS